MCRLTEADYKKYMKVLRDNIRDTEERIKRLGKRKKVAALSYDEWVAFQKGELKIYN